MKHHWRWSVVRRLQILPSPTDTALRQKYHHHHSALADFEKFRRVFWMLLLKKKLLLCVIWPLKFAHAFLFYSQKKKKLSPSLLLPLSPAKQWTLCARRRQLAAGGFCSRRIARALTTAMRIPLPTPVGKTTEMDSEIQARALFGSDSKHCTGWS